MTSRLGLHLLAVVLPAAALLLPSIAHAEKAVTEDAVGDVQSATLTDIDSDPALVAAPDDTSTDIVRTVAAHGNTRLSLTVHFRDLLNTSHQELYIKVLTPRLPFELNVVRTPGSRAKAIVLGPAGREVECRGLRASFDGGADAMSVSVPTTCLAGPRWVRVGVGALSYAVPDPDMVPDILQVFVDDGHRDVVRESIGKGPKIFRD